VSQADVRALELKAPKYSKRDAQVLQGQLLSGQIFSTFSQREREAIWCELRSIDCLIPSLFTFFEDLKYLSACADCLKRLVKLSRKDTVFTALRHKFPHRSETRGQYVLEVAEATFVVRSGRTVDRFDVGYRQLWLSAMRHYLEMPADTKKNAKDLLAKAGCYEADETILFELAALAGWVGFESKEIHDLKQRSSDREIACKALLKARKPDRYKYDNAVFEAHVTRIMEMFTTASPLPPERLSPAVVSDDPQASGNRCGLPDKDAYQHDSRLLFITQLHNESEDQGEEITSFFVRSSVYSAFFGKLVVPDTDGGSSPPQSPNSSAQGTGSSSSEGLRMAEGVQDCVIQEEERLVQERLERENLEEDRLARERVEQDRLAQDRLAQDRLEQERLRQLEQERWEREEDRLEQDRLEQDRLEQERLGQEKQEQEKREQERQQEERLRTETRKQGRREQEKALEDSERARKRHTQIDMKSLILGGSTGNQRGLSSADQGQEHQQAQAEDQQPGQSTPGPNLLLDWELVAADSGSNADLNPRTTAIEEQERLERERREQLEQERLEYQQEKPEQEQCERREQEHQDQEKKRERQKLEREQLQERLAQNLREQEKLEQEKLEQEKLEQEKLEQEKQEQEKREQERQQEERLRTETREQDRREQEKALEDSERARKRHTQIDMKSLILGGSTGNQRGLSSADQGQEHQQAQAEDQQPGQSTPGPNLLLDWELVAADSSSNVDLNLRTTAIEEQERLEREQLKQLEQERLERERLKREQEKREQEQRERREQEHQDQEEQSEEARKRHMQIDMESVISSRTTGNQRRLPPKDEAQGQLAQADDDEAGQSTLGPNLLLDWELVAAGSSSNIALNPQTLAKEEQDRLERERQEQLGQERLEYRQEKPEQEKSEGREQEHQDKEKKRERQKLERQQLQERLAQNIREQEKLEQEKQEQEKREQEKQEQEKREQERQHEERLRTEIREQDRREQEKALEYSERARKRHTQIDMESLISGGSTGNQRGLSSADQAQEHQQAQAEDHQAGQGTTGGSNLLLGWEPVAADPDIALNPQTPANDQASGQQVMCILFNLYFSRLTSAGPHFVESGEIPSYPHHVQGSGTRCLEDRS